MVNRQLIAIGSPVINRMRVYRIMEMNDLILPKTAKLRSNHEGTGKIETLHSNTRWCSDGFEINCWNGEKVFVASSLDYKDREVIHYVAKTEPLQNSDIQELMLISRENRFNPFKAPRTIQSLSERGSMLTVECY